MEIVPNGELRANNTICEGTMGYILGGNGKWVTGRPTQASFAIRARILAHVSHHTSGKPITPHSIYLCVCFPSHTLFSLLISNGFCWMNYICSTRTTLLRILQLGSKIALAFWWPQLLWQFCWGFFKWSSKIRAFLFMVVIALTILTVVITLTSSHHMAFTLEAIIISDGHI